MKWYDELHRRVVRFIVIKLLVGRMPKITVLPRDYTQEEIDRSKVIEDFINWYWNRRG